MSEDSSFKMWMEKQKKNDPDFYHHVQQGNPVQNKFKDYHPNKNITLTGLEELDNNFIFNDPIDE